MLGEIRTNTFGTQMKIIAVNTSQDIDVEFLDKHHYVKEHTTYSNFKNGQIKNPFDKTSYGVGYIGIGEFKTKINNHKLERYECWGNMIERCYSDIYCDIHKSYFQISEVCEEWLNYQKFSEWYEEHQYECDERLHLDKDIKYPGNKVYSPYHCLLVPQRINMLFTNKSNNRGLPNGIHKESDKFYAKYNGKELGQYKTLEESYSVYAKAKKDKIIEVANEYKNKIPNEVYEAIINYEVRIENDKNYIIGRIL